MNTDVAVLPVDGAADVVCGTPTICAAVAGTGIETADITVRAGVRSDPLLGAVTRRHGSSTDTWVFTPAGPLDPGTVYTALFDARDREGNICASAVWSFAASTELDDATPARWGVNVVAEAAMPSAPLAETALKGAGSPEVQGFARSFSVNVGGVVDFAIHGNACTDVDIYRAGGYSTGWRKVGHIPNSGVSQPDPEVIGGTSGMTTCQRWLTTATWHVPAGARSGLYIAVPRAPGASSHIPFVVREDGRDVAVVVRTSELSWGMAYNHYGTPTAPFRGRGFEHYGRDVRNRPAAVTLDRPIITAQTNAAASWYGSEGQLLRFLERQGIDYKVVASTDLESNSSVLGAAKVLISCGVDAYWTEGLRASLEGFRDSGGHLILMSGGAGRVHAVLTEDRRTLWLDSHGGMEAASVLTGGDFRVADVHNRSVTINATTYRNNPFWRGTPLADGQSITLPVLGAAVDAVVPMRAARDRRGTQLAGAVVSAVGRYDVGDGTTRVDERSVSWGITAYRRQDQDSAGTVVNFGTSQWPQLLGDDTAEAHAAQQATLNLLTDLGVGARSPQAHLGVTAPRSWRDYGLDTRPVRVDPVAPGTYEFMVSNGSMWYSVGGGDDEDQTIPKSVAVEFPTPMSTWVIDVGFLPNVTVVDSSGAVVEPGSITYNGTTATLEFSAPFSGTAYCFD